MSLLLTFVPNFDHRKKVYSAKFHDNCTGFIWTHIISLHFYNGMFAWFTLCKRAHKHKYAFTVKTIKNTDAVLVNWKVNHCYSYSYHVSSCESPDHSLPVESSLKKLGVRLPADKVTAKGINPEQKSGQRFLKGKVH